MSLENEDQHCLDEVAEGRQKPEKKLVIISYTRDFLLSLSELDVCKKLPSGFDQSILSEFEDTSQDRFRNPGSFSSQSYRRNEYGSSPPNRGDGSNHSRGVHGRWESRSSGRSDRDSDSQSDWDSDSGRRYSNPPRRPWQAPEHDGLLGSGSFARSSGYATAGPSASKLRANDNYPLNRSNEPYHPPRPYKAVPHSRRETNDSFNDETFGSSECTSEDRAEEERKRRDSFELMRKEQHKAFQEKQKLNPGKGKDEFDLSELLEDSKDDKKFLSRRAESDERVIQPASRNDSDKSFLTPAPVSRPLVPPGFSSTTAEKNIGMKSSSHPQPSEISNELEGGLHAKGRGLSSGISTNQEKKQFMEQIDSIAQQIGTLSAHGSVNKEDENILNISSALDVSSEAAGMDNRYYRTSKLSEAFESSENTEVIELDAKDVAGSKVVGDSSPTHSTSILDKLFGSALTLNAVGSSGLIEQHHDVKADDSWNPLTVQSSKFAQWFLEEEKISTADLSDSTNQLVADLSSGKTNKPVDDLTSGRPNDLLSLIVGGEKSGSHTYDVKAAENIPPNFQTQGSGLADGHATSELMPDTVENVNKQEAVSAVLTCEDLEQSMLSEISDNGSVLLPSVQGWSGSSARSEPKKADIDDNASQHLLSLLQMGTELPTNSGIIYSDKPQTLVENLDTMSRNSGETDPEHIHNAGKPLTLETLFGTAFMKELQSVGTQASGQRGLVGLMGGDVSEAPFPVMNDGHLASMGDASSISSLDNSILVSNQRQQMRSERIEEQILGFGSQKEVDSSQLRAELGSKLRGFDGPADFRLPEEESLITASDPLNLQNFVPARSSAKSELVAAAEFTEKLAALHPVYNQDGGPMIGNQEGSYFRGNFEMREPDVQYHKIHAQPSSPQLHPQLNHGGPGFHQLDSHPTNINAQMKLMAPENAIHHDAPNHQFPSNLIRPSFHHPSAALAGLDPSPRNPMLQQMHMPGNFPPPHLLRGFPRGPPLSPHPNNQATGFIQEPNPLHGFPFGQRQPNFNSLGVPPQAPDVGGGTHHPEALQRLIEMELRSNPKPIHPFATSSHNQGIYGHELDMGFRYR